MDAVVLVYGGAVTVLVVGCLSFKVGWFLRKWQEQTVWLREPWICFSAIKWLKKTVQKDWIVFEYGSGGSTLFFSDKCKKVYSVERFADWLEKVKLKIRKRNVVFFSSNIEKEYVGLFKSEADLVFIDGSFRVACLAHVWEKCKKGCVIIFDDVENEERTKLFGEYAKRASDSFAFSGWKLGHFKSTTFGVLIK